MDDTTEIDSNAIIDTEDYTEEDDEPEEEIYKMTAIDFAVDYLLKDTAFAEWHFEQTKKINPEWYQVEWSEVEQKYNEERKRLAQPAHRQPITVDMAAMRKAPKETGQRLFPALLQCVRDNPGMTAGEINSKLGRTKYLESAVYKCIEKNLDSFVRVPKRDIGGTRYLIYAKEEMVIE
jgi:hypothetical protein